MKKLSFLVMLFSFIGITSCSEGNSKSIPTFSDYDLEKLNLEFNAEESFSEFEFTSLDAWTATIVESDADATKTSEKTWVTLDIESGEKGVARITITASCNTTGVNRNIKVFINSTSGQEPLTINVLQKDVDSDGEKPEQIYPVDFKYLTLSRNDLQQLQPAISFIKNDGTVTANKYRDTNGRSIAKDPMSITQVQDKLVVAVTDYRGDNKVEVLDANTLKVIKTHSFGNEFMPYYILPIGGTKVVIVGESTKHVDARYSVVVADISADNIVLNQFNPGFRVHTAIKLGSKITMIGNQDTSMPDNDPYKLVVFDNDNITLEGMRTISDDAKIFSPSLRFVVDKNKKIWTLLRNSSASDGRAILASIDLEAETMNTLFPIDNTNIWNMPSATSIAICNKGEFVYIRSVEAFYKVCVDNPSAPDDPLFELMAETGIVSDLQFNKEGNIIFLDNVLRQNKPSLLYEYVESSDGSWSILNPAGVNVAPNAEYIYLAK